MSDNEIIKINRQKAEIERLESNLKFVRGTVSRQMEQMEILSKNADTAFQDGLNENQAVFEKTIIREFAERLKEDADGYDLCGDGIIYRMVDTEDIDNLVKEMTEEQKMKVTLIQQTQNQIFNIDKNKQLCYNSVYRFRLVCTIFL